MKLSKFSRSALPGLALLLATSAFAANKANKGSFEISEPLTVSGHELKPGQYKLTWEGTGGDVQAMILTHGKLVATVPAHLTDLNQPERNDAVVSRQNDDGSRSLTQIDFAGKKVVDWEDGTTFDPDTHAIRIRLNYKEAEEGSRWLG